MAKKFTGVEGSTVPLKETIEGFTKIADGDLDHVAELEPPAVGHRVDREVRDRVGAVRDRGAGGRSEFQVAGQEVGVEVGLDDPFDPEAERLGVGPQALQMLAARYLQSA